MAPALAAITYTYDQNGDMTSDGTKCYEYNEANQVKKVKNCSNSQTIAEYVYDYQGNRLVKKNYSSGALQKTTFSPNDGYETVKFASNSATQNTSYYFANDQLIAKKNPDGTKNYYHNDHLGSTSIMTSQTGTLVEETKYDPWGEVKTGGTKSKFLFTGQEKDLETNLNYYNARYYDSHIRRFTQPDDIIQNVYDPQSLNRYSYVLNNPLRYTDPSGKVAFLAVPLVWWAVGAFLGAGAVYTATPQGQKNTQTVANTVWNGASQFASQVKTGALNIGKNIVNTFNNKQTTSNNSSHTKSSGSSGGSQPKNNTPQIKNFDPNRNPAQDKKVPNSMIREIEKYLDKDIHATKGKDSSRYDIYKDDKGNLYQKPKGGKGPGEPLDLNIKDFN